MTTHKDVMENRIDLEVRHIEASKLSKLSAIIDKAKGWDILLDALSTPISSDNIIGRVQPLNLSLDDIELIKQQFYCCKSPTLALLNHWSITGRRRPTVRTLLFYLHACNLKWAEDYVKQAILGLPPAIQQPQAHQREPTNHFYAIQNDYIIDDEYEFDDLNEIIAQLEGHIQRYSFKSIFETTNRFCHRPFDPQTKLGKRIGDGRFSSVFLAQTQIESPRSDIQPQTVAAKLLKSECNKKYLANEISLARKIEHENILELLGISLGESFDGVPKFICLVYPYMQNGSLLNCLSFGLPCNNMEHVKWDKRVDIAVKVARGISYLHTFHEGPIIHRDIKTANILIDIDLEPKVGDFTLVRQLDSLRLNETQFSQNIIGTSVYMPPEAFRGDISTKFDTFSFGIVIFELLTGMRPFNEHLDQDLFTYISEKLSDIDDKLTQENSGSEKITSFLDESRDKFLAEILDKRADKWDFNIAKILFKLALQATENRKKNRPELTEILPILESTLKML